MHSSPASPASTPTSSAPATGGGTTTPSGTHSGVMIVTVPRVVQSIAAALIAVILLIVTTSRIAKVFDYLAQEYHPSAKNLETAALICLWGLILEVAVRLGAYFIWNKSLQSLVLRKRTALVGQWGFIALMAITALRLFVTGDGNLSSE